MEKAELVSAHHPPRRRKEVHRWDLGKRRLIVGSQNTTLDDISTVDEAQHNIQVSGAGKKNFDIVAGKGYFSTNNLCELEAEGHRPYLAEKAGRRNWSKGDKKRKAAVYRNRRRLKAKAGKMLHRRRCEMNERSFAHICDQGGARRTWIRGKTEISKRYLMQVAGRNLSVIMRKLFGIGKPKGSTASKRSVTARRLIDASICFLLRQMKQKSDRPNTWNPPVALDAA